ncbi:MAG: UDP-N-acetylmuramoylalanyl-D-glutamyl-2, 6-diaminopimelate--D-alanyl-D-alanine ligase [Gammaproteobacteria bacterium]|nr:MAG: UDP-N-acetylmuramoylalanyl-D-glutamyl-2, 6-diaminopimelate--D-alanyl-D-alanine ligase [Gammaproteobacteria bacterium]RLA49960.1 MAG: UDP-N-acetylmuramoylalanyl-D-glutamyl-2, 6-diaminopimelate--D-alanyl-D-alanine ligase [Gammaproteobacteria bacterium]
MTVHELILSQAAVAYGGTLLYPDCQFRSVSTDSRTLAAGDLFVALRGEAFDAHLFLKQAATRASGFVVQYPEKQLDIPQWVVPDTTLALGQLAVLARQQFDGPLIAITGSCGKTTVKEMLARILNCAAPVLATSGNLNNHIGVPKTLLALAPEHRFAVVEMGASAAGEIDYLVTLAKPTIAVITNVAPAHVEGFGSLAGVAAAKGEIYRGLDASATAVLNLDEPWTEQWRKRLPCLETVTFSIDKCDADVYASDIRLDMRGCAGFILHLHDEQLPVQLQISGRHNVNNALAATACALAAGMDATAIAAGLEATPAVAGRMEFKAGIEQCQVIDDSYNANPGSVKAAIDLLAELDGRRLLVLGDMAELGADARRLHREVGEYARDNNIDMLLATGELCAHAVAGFGAGAQSFNSKAELCGSLVKELRAGVTVLVKGSRSASMDEVVKQITSRGNA